jgi:hypothetical protein
VPVDLHEYANVFEDAAKCFVSNMRELAQTNAPRSSRQSRLEVLNVGSYKVSLAANIADLRRIDENVFKVAPGKQVVRDCRPRHDVEAISLRHRRAAEQGLRNWVWLHDMLFSGCHYSLLLLLSLTTTV